MLGSLNSICTMLYILHRTSCGLVGKIILGEEPALSVGSCSNSLAWGHHR